jgi:hypothetical protein
MLLSPCARSSAPADGGAASSPSSGRNVLHRPPKWIRGRIASQLSGPHTNKFLKTRWLRSAPGPAPAPRQTPTRAAAATAAAAAAPSASSAASAADAAPAATAADSASAAAASAASAAAASAASAASSELKQGPRLVDTFFFEKVERSQGDVGYLLLTYGKRLNRRCGRRWHTRYRFAGRRSRCSQGYPGKAKYRQRRLCSLYFSALHSRHELLHP